MFYHQLHSLPEALQPEHTTVPTALVPVQLPRVHQHHLGTTAETVVIPTCTALRVLTGRQRSCIPLVLPKYPRQFLHGNSASCLVLLEKGIIVLPLK